MPPILSIGMPVYNGSKYIREALNSLLNQTHKDYELIISDNASIDNTQEICLEYSKKDSRIRYIRQRSNMGAASNFRFVLAEAKGKYFMWAASDDIWSNKWIEILLPISKKNSCLAYGSVQSIDEFGHNIQHPANNRRFDYQSSLSIARRLKYLIEPDVNGKANPIYGIYPKHTLTDNITSTLSESALGADMLFLYSFLKENNIKSSNQVILKKRIHNESEGHSTPKESISKTNRRINFIIYPIKMHIKYLKISSSIEKIIITLSSPINIISWYFSNLNLKNLPENPSS